MQVDPYNGHKMVVGCTAGFMTHKHQHRPLSSFRHYESFLLICFFWTCALTLLVGWHEGHPAFKKTEWWVAGVVIYLEQGADLHMAQLMPLPLTVSCSSKIQIGFTFLVPAHLGLPTTRQCQSTEGNR